MNAAFSAWSPSITRPVTCGRTLTPVARSSHAASAAALAYLSLETVDLYSLGIKTEAIFLIGEEILDVLALVALELDHLSHLGVGDDGAIAGKLLLDHFKDLLLVELLRQTLDRRQRLATIAL
jgi:hypothetical protein